MFEMWSQKTPICCCNKVKLGVCLVLMMYIDGGENNFAEKKDSAWELGLLFLHFYWRDMESECATTPPPDGLTEGNPSKSRQGYASSFFLYNFYLIRWRKCFHVLYMSHLFMPISFVLLLLFPFSLCLSVWFTRLSCLALSRTELHDNQYVFWFYRRTSGPTRRSTRGQWTAEEV